MIQVYGQDSPHDPLLIMGDRESLQKLRASIDKALETNDFGTHVDFPADGEGYNIIVACEEAGGDLWSPNHYGGCSDSQWVIFPDDKQARIKAAMDKAKGSTLP